MSFQACLMLISVDLPRIIDICIRNSENKKIYCCYVNIIEWCLV